MPAAYTHLTFGLAVEKTFAGTPIAQIIKQHKELYLIGLHGPDILFYYKALGQNPVNKQGNSMHFVSALPFFVKSRDVVNNAPDKDAALAYIYGFICHLALDYACHSYVEHCIQLSGMGHTEIETYLDRSYLLKDGRNPLKHNVASHIAATDYAGRIIAPFFTDVTPLQLTQSLKGMRMYNGLFLPSNPLKEGIVRLGMKILGKYDSLSGLIMRHSSNAATDRMVNKLQSLLEEAVPVAADMITQYDLYRQFQGELDARFDKHFSFYEELMAQYTEEDSYEKTNQTGA